MILKFIINYPTVTVISILFLIVSLNLVLKQQNILTILIFIGILNGILNLNFVVLSLYFDEIVNRLFILIILTLAVAEFVIGLALLAKFYNLKHSIKPNYSKTNARNWFKRITLSLEITIINMYIRLSDKHLLIAFLSMLYLTKFSIGLSFEECTLCAPSSSTDSSGEVLPTSVTDTDVADTSVTNTNKGPTTPKKSKWETWGWGADGPREYDNPIFWGYMTFTAIAIIVYFIKYGIPK